MTKTVWLVISADRRARIVARVPNLFADEVAYRLMLNFPTGWGSVIGTLSVDVPGAPVAEVGERIEPEPDEDDEPLP